MRGLSVTHLDHGDAPHAPPFQPLLNDELLTAALYHELTGYLSNPFARFDDLCLVDQVEALAGRSISERHGERLSCAARCTRAAETLQIDSRVSVLGLSSN